MEKAIQVQDLHKYFGEIHAVEGVSFEVPAGQIYGLLGPNGSGKTTLIRLLIGLLKPTSGQVTTLGRRMPDKAVLSQVGYMTQTSALYEDLTLRENVRFFAGMCGETGWAGVDDVIKLVELEDRANSLVRTLSGGMKQRTSLACALAHRPRLLLLDEPTVGIDPQLRVAFWEHFRRLTEKGVTIIVSSHVMDEAERCDRLGFIRRGQLLAEGSAEEIREQAGADTLEGAFLHFATSAAAGGTA